LIVSKFYNDPRIISDVWYVMNGDVLILSENYL